MSQQPPLVLKPEPDGFGFLYGTITAPNGVTIRVDIMPPLPHWRGDIKLNGEGAPHPTDWVVFWDGEEVARVTARDDIAPAVLALGFKPNL